jgi:hypothetical protein
MPANIYNENVYSFKKQMWHGLGEVGREGESAVSVFGRMEPITFEKRPFAVMLNGKTVESGDFAIVKLGKSEIIIGNTKDRYELMQLSTYCQLYDDAVRKPVETLGFIGSEGSRMFLTWELPEIDIHGDKVCLYGFLCVGFDGLFGEDLYLTNVRVVCQNTWNMAISNAKNTQNHGRGTLYSGKHNNKNHARDLSAWMSHIQGDAEKNVEIVQNLFCKMDTIKVNKDQAYGLFNKIYKDPEPLPDFYPETLRAEKQKVIDDKTEKAQENRDLAMELFGGKGIEIAPTAWGCLQTVTEAENWHKPSKKDASFSILLGNKHNIMTTAIDVISDYVNIQ